MVRRSIEVLLLSPADISPCFLCHQRTNYNHADKKMNAHNYLKWLKPSLGKIICLFFLLGFCKIKVFWFHFGELLCCPFLYNEQYWKLFFWCAWCQRWSTGDLPPHVCNTDKPTVKTASQNIFAKDVMAEDTFSKFLDHTAAAERSRLKLKSCKRIYPVCTSLVGRKNQAITKSFSASTIWHCQDSHYINLNFKLNGNVHNV